VVSRKRLQKGKFIAVHINGLFAGGAMDALIVHLTEPSVKLQGEVFPVFKPAPF
jgi:hypothetical protein